MGISSQAEGAAEEKVGRGLKMYQVSEGDCHHELIGVGSQFLNTE